MRRLLLWFALLTVGSVSAQVPSNPFAPRPVVSRPPLPGPAAPSPVVQEFTGSGSTTTSFFKVQDRWEIRWNARRAVSVAVMSSDGTIVAGGAGVLRGSLFLPLGGQYYLKITDGGDAGTGDAAGAPDAGEGSPGAEAAHAEAMSWHLQIVQLGTTVASSEALTVYTPYFLPPDAAVTPPPAPPPEPKLTEAQMRAVVVVKGDRAQEIGFLLKMPEGSFVVTHLHLLAANPNVHVFTPTGTPISTVALKGAPDRDIALLTVQNPPNAPLSLPADFAATAQLGDRILIPGLGPSNEIMLGRTAKLVGVAPDRVDVDERLDDSENGAPVIHGKSGTVLALVTATPQVNLTSDIARAWPANPAPGSASLIPYYGLRIDTIRGWQTYDSARFLAETLFLKEFHLETRYLDSYLNGKRRRGRPGPPELGPPDDKFFENSPKIKEADDHYKQMATGGDKDERYESGRELLFTLGNIADIDVDRLEGINSPYSYDQTLVKEESAYRAALKKEIDNLSNNPDQLDTMMAARGSANPP